MTGSTVSHVLRSSVLWPTLIAIGATAGLMIWRSYPWQLALMAGGAIGVLVYFSLSAARRLHREYFGPRS